MNSEEEYEEEYEDDPLYMHAEGSSDLFADTDPNKKVRNRHYQIHEQTDYLPMPETKPMIYRIKNIPLNKENKAILSTDEEISEDIEQIAVKEFDKDYLANKIFESNVSTQVDDKSSDPRGNCQQVTFWQFAKLIRLPYEGFMVWLKSAIEVNSLDEWKFDNYLQPIWDLIYAGKMHSWRQFLNRNQYRVELKYHEVDPKYRDTGNFPVDVDDIQDLFHDHIQYAIFDVLYSKIIEKINENRAKLDKLDNEEIDWLTSDEVYPSETFEEMKKNFADRRKDILKHPYIVPKNENKFRYYVEFISQYTNTIPFIVHSYSLTSKEYKELLKKSIDEWPIYSNHIFVMVYDADKKILYDFNNNNRYPLIMPINANGYPEIYSFYMAVYEEVTPVAYGIAPPFPPDKAGYFDPGLKAIESICSVSIMTTESPALKKPIDPDYTAALCFDMFIQITRLPLDEYIELFKTLGTCVNFPARRLEHLIECFTNTFKLAESRGIYASQDWLKDLYIYRNPDGDVEFNDDDNMIDLLSFIDIYIDLTTGIIYPDDIEIKDTKQYLNCSESRFEACLDILCERFKYAPLFNLVFVKTYGVQRYVFRQYGFTFFTQEYLHTYNKAKENTFITIYPSLNIGSFYHFTNSEFYYAAWNRHPYESIPFPRFQPYEIKPSYISQLMDIQKDRQLTKAYNIRIL